MNNFLCPFCMGHLRVGEHIIFSIRNKQKKGGLIMLSASIGNYSSHVNPAFSIQEGEQVDFFCPICHSDLKSDVHTNLVKVVMVDQKGNYFDVFFSKIAGEHSTYKTLGEELEAKGKDAGKYTYFRVGERFRKFL